MKYVWLVAVAALAMTAPGPLVAQTASLAGTYVLHADGSDDINASIDDATSKMNFAIRGIARSRLRKTNTPFRRLTIAHTPQEVTVTTDTRAPIRTPANGTPIRWRREDGEMLNVSTEWKGGLLEQTFVAEDGQRVNRYSISGDGRLLTMEVTITSPRLPKPLVYKQMYHRV